MRLAFAALTLLLALPAAAEDRAKMAPFEADDINGERVESSDFAGKPLVVTFWATWCVPCKKAIPALEKLVKKHGEDKIGAVAISIDDTRTQSRVRGTARRYKWKMPVLVDRDGDIAKSLNPRGLAPYTLLIDKKGRIAHAHEGFSAGDEKMFAEWLEKLVAEPAP